MRADDERECWKGCRRRRNIVGYVCWSGTLTLGPREDIVDDGNGLLKFVAEEEWEGRLARDREGLLKDAV